MEPVLVKDVDCNRPTLKGPGTPSDFLDDGTLEDDFRGSHSRKVPGGGPIPRLAL
jgi:hypothetical protein